MAHVQFSVDETKDIDHASRPLLDDAERGFDDGDEADRAAYEADHDDWIRSDTQSVDSVVSLGDQGGEVRADRGCARAEFLFVPSSAASVPLRILEIPSPSSPSHHTPGAFTPRPVADVAGGNR